MSISAYKRTIKDTESPRDIERRIISRVNGNLEKIQKDFDTREDKKDIIPENVRQALWENQQLWITLKADLMSSGNQLSEETRASLISLSIWVDDQTNKVMGGSGNILPLVEMNKNIIKGLSGRSE